MNFDTKTLRKIYDRTEGRCHICKTKRALKNYGQPALRGAWEVDHSKPQSKGGTHHLNNLYVACPSCNRSKGNSHNLTARAKHGHKAAPLSKVRASAARKENATIGAIFLGGFGAAVAGPVGAAIGAKVGHAIGKSVKVHPR